MPVSGHVQSLNPADDACAGPRRGREAEFKAALDIYLARYAAAQRRRATPEAGGLRRLLILLLGSGILGARPGRTVGAPRSQAGRLGEKAGTVLATPAPSFSIPRRRP
jgi:hypothetical protein